MIKLYVDGSYKWARKKRRSGIKKRFGTGAVIIKENQIHRLQSRKYKISDFERRVCSYSMELQSILDGLIFARKCGFFYVNVYNDVESICFYLTYKKYWKYVESPITMKYVLWKRIHDEVHKHKDVRFHYVNNGNIYHKISHYLAKKYSPSHTDFHITGGDGKLIMVPKGAFLIKKVES